MFPKMYPTGKILKKALATALINRGTTMTTEKWQGVEGRKMNELINVAYQVPLSHLGPDNISPNLPWADEHFEERISGLPLNPPPSNERWPFNKKANAAFKKDEQFSHTYPERFWPKFAGNSNNEDMGAKFHRKEKYWRNSLLTRKGIRFYYGDLRDVINLLIKEPNTRQAYLPIWFPEDTGVVHGERVPCSIGYHFQIRDGFLHCSYTMRSCDFLLHWDDDMFLAMRLSIHILSKLVQADRPNTEPLFLGFLNCQIYNLHHFYEGKDIVLKISNHG